MREPPLGSKPQSRRTWLLVAAASLTAAAVPSLVHAGRRATRIDVRRNPGCGCCEKWVEHMRGAGFEVAIQDDPQLAEYKASLGIPKELESCHTARGDGYTFEGHIPATTIQRFLRERPLARGLAVAGMPAGSPGMESPNPVAYDVMAFDATKTWVWEKVTP